MSAKKTTVEREDNLDRDRVNQTGLTPIKIQTPLVQSVASSVNGSSTGKGTALGSDLSTSQVVLPTTTDLNARQRPPDLTQHRQALSPIKRPQPIWSSLGQSSFTLISRSTIATWLVCSTLDQPSQLSPEQLPNDSASPGTPTDRFL